MSDAYSASAVNGYTRSLTTAEDREASPLRDPSPVRVITGKDFAKIVDRLYQTQKSYNERRERKVKERDAAEMENVLAKPKICKRSAEMASSVAPLTARQSKLLEERAEVLKAAQAKAQAAERAKIHGPHLCPRSHNIKRTVDDLQKWNEAKIEKRKEMQTKKSNAEVYSFQPQVNSKSTKIFKQFRQTDEAHWDRMLRESDEKKAKQKLEHELGADAQDSKFYPDISQRARRSSVKALSTSASTRARGTSASATTIPRLGRPQEAEAVRHRPMCVGPRDSSSHRACNYASIPHQEPRRAAEKSTSSRTIRSSITFSTTSVRLLERCSSGQRGATSVLR
jgi:hypothetical protein